MWRIDPNHSSIAFSVKHMMVATIHGRFGGFDGTIRYDGSRPWATQVDVQIDAATINTGVRMRDDHLRSPDFFDIVAFPTISFRSTRVEPPAVRGRTRWLVVGDLAIHGLTRSVELDVNWSGVPGRRSADVIEFTAAATIHRKDFGMTFNLPIDAGGLVVGDEVRIDITVQADRIPSSGDRFPSEPTTRKAIP
jgi:polyisoprenoid-binding protein YceI